jgi:hypothetical protein
MPNNKKQKEIKSSTPTSNESSSTNHLLRKSTRTCKQVISTLSEDQKKLDSSEIRSDLSLTNDLFFPIDTDNQKILFESTVADTNAAESQKAPDNSPENREKLVNSEIRSESSFTSSNNVESQVSPARSDFQSVTTNNKTSQPENTLEDDEVSAHSILPENESNDGNIRTDKALKNQNTCDRIPKKNPVQQTPIFSSSTEIIHPISLTMLTMLLHSTNECLLCQPKANYCALGINDLKKKEFLSAMTKTGEDVMEEMYGFLYEITTDQNDTSTVPIYTTYYTSKGQDDYLELQNYAKSPTCNTLRDLAKALKITDLPETTDPTVLMTEVFQKMTTPQLEIQQKKFFTTSIYYIAKYQTKEAGDARRIASYLDIRETFQSQHPIRIAIIGGLHRSALALHILGNYKITNDKPKKYEKPFYQLKIDSPINSEIALHVFSNENKTLDEEFLAASRTFSEQVNDRRRKAVEVMIAMQMWDLLKNKSTVEVNEHRYLPRELFNSKYVSLQVENCELSVFFDILTIVFLLVLLDD